MSSRTRSLPGFGRCDGRVRGVEIRHVAGRSLKGSEANAPGNVGNRLRVRTDEFDAGRAEERHGKITGQMDPLAVIPDVDREGLHQVLAAIAVVQGAGAEEERHGSVDGRLFAVVPGDAEAGSRKGQRRGSRHSQFQRSQHRRRLRDPDECDRCLGRPVATLPASSLTPSCLPAGCPAGEQDRCRRGR